MQMSTVNLRLESRETVRVGTDCITSTDASEAEAAQAMRDRMRLVREGKKRKLSGAAEHSKWSGRGAAATQAAVEQRTITASLGHERAAH